MFGHTRIKQIVSISKEIQNERDRLAEEANLAYSLFEKARQAEWDFIKMNTPSGIVYHYENKIVSRYYVGYEDKPL